MSSNEHLNKIGKATHDILHRYQPLEDGQEADWVATRVGTINEHAEALQAELDAERARVERLQDAENKLVALVTLLAGPDAIEHDLQAAIAMARRGLKPGDLPAAESEARR